MAASEPTNDSGRFVVSAVRTAVFAPAVSTALTASSTVPLPIGQFTVVASNSSGPAQVVRKRITPPPVRGEGGGVIQS